MINIANVLNLFCQHTVNNGGGIVPRKLSINYNKKITLKN